MASLNEIAVLLRSELAQHYATVRLSALQTQEQFTKELKALNPEKLPGVIIVFDSMLQRSTESYEEIDCTLVLVDRFRAGSDEKALSLFSAASELMTLFPASGRRLGGVFVISTDCVASGVDDQFAALAVGIKFKQ